MNFITKIENKNTNIFLYIPNIIDYLRVIFLIVAIIVSKTDPIIFFSSYFLSFCMDLFDGMAARHFNQTSKFGGTLDMVIDRISTSGLLMILSGFYTNYSHFFILLMMLDIGSHWLQTHSGFMDVPKLGKILNDNHKDLEEKFTILNFYYKNKYGLGIICLGAELFLLELYFIHFYKDILNNSFFLILLTASGLIYALKQFISCIQLISASQRIVRFDLMELNLKK